MDDSDIYQCQKTEEIKEQLLQKEMPGSGSLVAKTVVPFIPVGQEGRNYLLRLHGWSAAESW